MLYLRVETGVEPDLNVLANVFTALNQSFYNFVSTELVIRNGTLKAALKKETGFFATECKLPIYDIVLSSSNIQFTIGINELTGQYRALKNAAELKEELFALFVNTVFSTQLFTAGSIKKLTGKYTIKQRINIFKPIADLVEKQQLLLYFGETNTAENLLWPSTIDLFLKSSLLPEAIKLPKEPFETYFQYIKTGEENDLFGKRSRYEKVLVKEALQHDLYPYQLQNITMDGKKYTFAKTLSAVVSVKNNQYEISSKKLSIAVNHETRAGAEKAFDAAVSSLIKLLKKNDQHLKEENLIKLKAILTEF